jgi:hypothetical protein
VRRLARLREALDADIGALRLDSPTTIARGHALERDVLMLHNMWEFYRSRLAQRFVPWMKRFLDAADDYAWACLQPVIAAAVTAKHVTAASVREPPLTFLNGEWSPFASTRGTALMSETFAPSDLERQAFIREVKSLPLSVLGLPWYQLSHLPDVLILAHETGHVVEDDLKLTESLGRVLDETIAARGIPAHRASGWRAWLGEAFADTFGTVAGGRGFGCALADFVTLDVKAVRAEALAFPNWGVYPTTDLRLRLSAGGLTSLGDADGAREITERAVALMDGHAPMAAFHDDCAVIARAWLETPLDALGGQTLLAIARVPPPHWADAKKVSSAALRSSAAAPSRDVRAAQSRIITWLETSRATGVRNVRARDAGTRAGEADGTETFDEAAAAAQLARFSSRTDIADDGTT